MSLSEGVAGGRITVQWGYAPPLNFMALPGLRESTPVAESKADEK